MIAEQIWICR